MDSPERRADLDFLRVGAILLLHLFHTGMMFNTWAWHVKSPDLLPWMKAPWEVMHALRMPLLMLVAGAGTALALGKRSLGAFAADRAKRLLIPLVFGIFVLVPPQIYIERIVQGICRPTYLEQVPGSAFQGSFWDFYPRVFEMRAFPQGDTSWHHLWFVAYLFVFCMAALPVFAWLKRPSGERFLDALAARLSRGWWILLGFAPLALAQILLRRFPMSGDLVHDPRILAYFGLLFLYGHVLTRRQAILERIVALRHPCLGLGLLLYGGLAPEGDWPFPFEHLGVYAFVWLMLLAALGYARRVVTKRGPALAYAQSVAYPFYIFHQTVIVLVGFASLRWAMPVGIRFAAVLAVSFTITWLCCELFRRVRILRPLAGLPPEKKPSKRALASGALVEVG